MRVVELALKQEFLLVASQHIFDEIQRNLVRKIGLSVRDAQKLLDDIAEVAALFDPGGSLTITADSNDNLVIETALMGFAEILVTGDRELVDLKTVGQLRIETTSVFLERFKK